MREGIYHSVQEAIKAIEILEKEEAYFDKLVADKNLNTLISRYPLKKTGVLEKIAEGLGIKRDEYESAVRKLIIDDIETREYFKTLLQPLTDLMNPPPLQRLLLKTF